MAITYPDPVGYFTVVGDFARDLYPVCTAKTDVSALVSTLSSGHRLQVLSTLDVRQLPPGTPALYDVLPES